MGMSSSFKGKLAMEETFFFGWIEEPSLGVLGSRLPGQVRPAAGMVALLPPAQAASILRRGSERPALGVDHAGRRGRSGQKSR